jgi:RNA polymerase sigma factor (sigma-70 family)
MLDAVHQSSKSIAARNKLVESQLHLVRNIAGQLLSSALYISFDDLISYGHQGLIAAATNFDPTRGTPFPGYADACIRGAMREGFRKEGHFARMAAASFDDAKTNPKVIDVDADLDQLLPLHFPTVEDDTDYNRLVSTLATVVQNLPTHLREFTKTHYFDELSLHDVARDLGISKYAVHRLRNSALRELSSQLTTHHRTILTSTRGVQ